MRHIEIYDTTLRDGTQGEDFTLSLEDKIRIALKLDELGIHYIEGGWPGSNPKDEAFFSEIRNYEFKNSKIAAFGSTHYHRGTPENDNNLKALINARTDVITIFGKSWTVHVTDALRTTLERNLEIIHDSLAYLRPHVEKLFYDAEHFFDGFKADKEYALATLEQAVKARADCLILCDTNGGCMPNEIYEIVQVVKEKFPNMELGIHVHNDADVAVANSIMAVLAGVNHVQGTINGVGERCGNANLCSIIPNICLKLKLDCLPQDKLKKLTDTSNYVAELANVTPNKYQPYVGKSAFAHKGGVHISAVERNPLTYEHIQPELVGNYRRILISDLAGKSAIKRKAAEFGIELSTSDPVARQVLEEIKELENQGFQYEAADGSFELLLHRAMGRYTKYFDLIGFRVIDQKASEHDTPVSEATIMVKVGGKIEHTAALGNGPVNALDNALRKALEKFYPTLKDVRLSDYKVRVLPGSNGTASKVRVLIESMDSKSTWGTVGVSEDILEASWQALVDSINYKMFKDKKESTKEK